MLKFNTLLYFLFKVILSTVPKNKTIFSRKISIKSLEQWPLYTLLFSCFLEWYLTYYLLLPGLSYHFFNFCLYFPFIFTVHFFYDVILGFLSNFRFKTPEAENVSEIFYKLTLHPFFLNFSILL